MVCKYPVISKSHASWTTAIEIKAFPFWHSSRLASKLFLFLPAIPTLEIKVILLLIWLHLFVE